MNPGQMRQVIRLERRTTTQDAAGEPLDNWLLVADLRAEIERMTGHEAFTSQQRFGKVPTLFHVRYRDGITPDLRLTCNDTVYEIISAVDPDGMRAELLITATENVGQGPTS